MPGPVLDLQQAGAANHRGYFTHTAHTTPDGTALDRHSGVIAHQPGAALMVGFPTVPIAELSEFADEVVELARQHPRSTEVGWWTLDEADVPAVGARLLARGFHWGWRPNWMALDVTRLVADHPVPDGLEIRPVGDGFEAWLARGRVGGVAFHRSEFDGRPIGGIHDMFVAPEARRRGIGTALTVAACMRAGGLGCDHVVLNATTMGQSVYARAGFELLGESGQTWWLPKENIERPPPSRATVEFAEAIGSGDLGTAEAALRGEGRDLDQPLPCGLTPLGIAAAVGAGGSARWLLARGATLDVVSAWDLGWRADAAEALASDPKLANLPTGPWRLPPLHVAAQRGDTDLACLVLGADPDRTATTHGKDAVEWAHLHGHPELARLIADWGRL